MLLFGSENWVLTEAKLKNLEGRTRGFTAAGDRDEGEKVRGKDLERGGGRQGVSGGGNQTYSGIH